MSNSFRLNTQHLVMQETLGFLLHPSMEIPDTYLRIADVACGTGSWLLELSKTCDPTCQFDGFDIDSIKFPDVDLLPKNVNLWEHNVLKPFPAEFRGQYDVVNLRLLVLALEKDDWDLLTKNVRTLLSMIDRLQVLHPPTDNSLRTGRLHPVGGSQHG